MGSMHLDAFLKTENMSYGNHRDIGDILPGDIDIAWLMELFESNASQDWPTGSND